MWDRRAIDLLIPETEPADALGFPQQQPEIDSAGYGAIKS